MAEIWFIRHGESASNIGSKTEYEHSIPLTTLGHQQSAEVSAIFDQPLDLIVMSPYIRTQFTAEPTIHRYPDAAREIWPIQEFSYLSGEKYKNTTVEDRKPAVREYWLKRDPDHKDSTDAESFSDMVNRVRDMVKRLEQSPHERIAVFCHGLILHTLEIIMKEPDLPLPDVMDKLNHIRQHAHMPNTHVIKAKTENGKLILSEPPERKARRCPKPLQP